MIKILVTSLLLFPLMSFGKECTYSWDQAKSSVEGTGFKFTEKVGVKAKFPKYSLNKATPQKSVKELLQGLVVSVDLNSIDSGNAVRDKNLVDTFFSNIKDPGKAQVTVKSVGKKSIEASLKINGVMKPVRFDYSMKNDQVVATGRFDALAYTMGKAYNALKERCKVLHTGKDGVSKMWSDFDLKVVGQLKKVCK